jgi:hypothetical protein
MVQARQQAQGVEVAAVGGRTEAVRGGHGGGRGAVVGCGQSELLPCLVGGVRAGALGLAGILGGEGVPVVPFMG